MDEHKATIELFRDMLEYKKKEAKFLFIVLIISLCMNVVEVTAFLWLEMHTEETVTTTTTTQTVDGTDNDIVNGDQYNDESQNNSGGDDK